MLLNKEISDYTIEELLREHQNYIKNKTYKLEGRSGFVCPGDICPDKGRMNRDNEKMINALYSPLNAMIKEMAAEELDKLDGEQNPIFSPQGISKELLAQITDRVIDRLTETDDMPAEARCLFEEEGFAPMSCWMFVKAAAEAVTLNEIFARRRL